MGDQHKGPHSLDARFARFSERIIRPRLPALIALTSAAAISYWYATHWVDVYTRAQRSLYGIGDPDTIMGLLAALIFTAGYALSALVRLLPR